MLLDQLSKHRCMGNVMKISLPFPKGVFYVISRHEYHALLALGKDIPPDICVLTHFSFHCFD